MIAQDTERKRKSTGQEGAKASTGTRRKTRENFHEETGNFQQTHRKGFKKESTQRQPPSTRPPAGRPGGSLTRASRACLQCLNGEILKSKNFRIVSDLQKTRGGGTEGSLKPPGQVRSGQVRSGRSLSRVRLYDPVDCSMPGRPVHHQLPEFTKTLAHQAPSPCY